VGFVVEKAARGQFSPSTSFSPANHHSTNFSILIITRDWQNMPIDGRIAEWTQLHSNPTITIKKSRVYAILKEYFNKLSTLMMVF
jgi:hypothetical protein